MLDKGVVHIVVAGYIVAHYCLMFDRGVVHIVVYQKTSCSEIGQTIYDRRSTNEDSTCSCDYAKGYGFVAQPKNIKYCIPSKEDCSCYLVQCADNNTLSSGKLGLNFESRVSSLL
jgi:hypothetical protein